MTNKINSIAFYLLYCALTMLLFILSHFQLKTIQSKSVKKLTIARGNRAVCEWTRTPHI